MEVESERRGREGGRGGGREVDTTRERGREREKGDHRETQQEGEPREREGYYLSNE